MPIGQPWTDSAQSMVNFLPRMNTDATAAGLNQSFILFLKTLSINALWGFNSEQGAEESRGRGQEFFHAPIVEEIFQE
jgi:hypothetical protein